MTRRDLSARGSTWTAAGILLSVLLLALGGCSSEPRPLPPIGDVPRIADSFRSGGRDVRLEVMPAAGGGWRPAVLILHGASGIGSGHMIYPYAAAIAGRGIHVFIAHYFDGLAAGSNRSGTAHFAERERIIADAVTHIRGRPEVDPARVGLWGLSLGGFHALSHASRDPHVAAVVNVMGAMPHSVPLDRVGRMPPTLIIHGTRDRVVPMRRVAALAALLDRIGTPYETRFYEGAGHALRGDALADSVWRSADFFDRYLNGGAVAGAALWLR